MEYVIGSITTLIVIWLAYRFFQYSESQTEAVTLRYRQSHIHQLIKPAIPLLNMVYAEELVTQATKHYKRNHVKILVVDEQAYWIKDNTFYVADMIDGYVDQESAKIVDTMTMDNVELDKMMFIVEQLTKGS